MAHIEKSDCFQQCICPFLSAFAGLCQTAFIGNLEDTNMQSTLSQFVFFPFFLFRFFFVSSSCFLFFSKEKCRSGIPESPEKKNNKKETRKKAKKQIQSTLAHVFGFSCCIFVVVCFLVCVFFVFCLCFFYYFLVSTKLMHSAS